jgi:hypothetical protein
MQLLQLQTLVVVVVVKLAVAHPVVLVVRVLSLFVGLLTALLLLLQQEALK